MGLTTLLIRMRYGGLGYNPHIIRQPRKRSEPRGDEDFQMASNRQKKKRRLSRMMSKSEAVTAPSARRKPVVKTM